jgi:hypothetical protein
VIEMKVNDTALPESPVDGLEPMLNPAQLAAWMGVSPWYVNFYGRRKRDPLPLHGTPRARRAVPSEVREWMKRNKNVD